MVTGQKLFQNIQVCCIAMVTVDMFPEIKVLVSYCMMFVFQGAVIKIAI